jgi:hypothetical protein
VRVVCVLAKVNTHSTQANCRALAVCTSCVLAGGKHTGKTKPMPCQGLPHCLLLTQGVTYRESNSVPDKMYSSITTKRTAAWVRSCVECDSTSRNLGTKGHHVRFKHIPLVLAGT